MEYKDLFSDEEIFMTKKQYFVNKNGVCNTRGLNEYIKDPESVPDKYFIYMGIDLSELNKKSRAMGDYMLTKILQSLRGQSIFHLYGGKYVIFCKTEEDRDKTVTAISRKREGAIIYYSINEIDREKSFDEQINNAYDTMNEQKKNRILDAISSGRGGESVPEEFRETDEKKFVNTFIYTDYLVCPQGQYNDTKVIIYPLEYKRGERVRILCIVSSEFKQRAFIGEVVGFGISGTVYEVTGRFTEGGTFDTVLFATNNKSSDVKHQVKGIGIPQNFGKKIEDTLIFPYKNAFGKVHYAIVKGDKVEITKDEFVTINNSQYHINLDEVTLTVLKVN